MSASSAIIDSGTTAIVMSSNDAARINKVRTAFQSAYRFCCHVHSEQLVGNVSGHLNAATCWRQNEWLCLSVSISHIHGACSCQTMPFAPDFCILDVACCAQHMCYAYMPAHHLQNQFQRQIQRGAGVLNGLTKALETLQLIGGQSWQSQQVYNVTCDITSLPDVTFVLGGQSFAVPPRLYVQRVSSTDRLHCCLLMEKTSFQVKFDYYRFRCTAPKPANVNNGNLVLLKVAWLIMRLSAR